MFFFYVVEMRCLFRSLHFIWESVLKKHYVDYHFINDQDIFLKICSRQIQLTRHAEFAKKLLKVLEVKKYTCSFFTIETISRWVEIEALEPAFYLLMFFKREPIAYYSINFNQHQKFYDFFSSGTVDTFLESVYEIYLPTKVNKFQGYAEIVNEQGGEIILEDK